MSETTSETTVELVEDVIHALTGPVDGGELPSLRDSIERAGREFTARTAESFAKALVEHLAENPGSMAGLEALVVLGLAFPKVLGRHHIQLVQEGRRLAVLMEEAGSIERAQVLLEALAAQNPDDKTIDHDLASMMRRTGNQSRLIERYMRRAEASARSGRRDEAVTWLREVLLIDRSRRDVARMIRDLRYEDVERRKAWRGRGQLALVTIVICGLFLGAVARELSIQRKYTRLPHAPAGDAAALRERLNGINDLISGNPLWFGMFRAGVERSELRTEIDRIEADQAERERRALEALAAAENEAESERIRGRAAAESGSFEIALGHFLRSLEVCPEDWEHSERVEADVAAIQAWIREQESPEQEPVEPETVEPETVEQEPVEQEPVEQEPAEQEPVEQESPDPEQGE